MTIKDYTFKLPKIKTNVFDVMKINGHEQLVFGYDKKINMKVVLAIHDTTLGPSTGGIRMAKVSEEVAIEEALRLSYAMTFKNAIIDEPFGGSKAVVIGDPQKDKSVDLLYAIGDFIESMRGAFLTGVDMGLSLDDAKIIRKKTKYIFNSKGCSGITTGHGVYKGIKETVKTVFGSGDLKNKTVAIQGLGYVGATVAELLLKDGAKLIVTDTDPEVIKKFQNQYHVEVVDTNEIHKVPCDIFSPNAVGEILNKRTIPALKCKIVAGGANNQFQDEVNDSTALHKRGILHAPDFVINAGGVCHGMCEVKGVDTSYAMKKTDLIPKLLKKVFEISKNENIPPIEVAYQLAHEKIKASKKTK